MFIPYIMINDMLTKYLIPCLNENPVFDLDFRPLQFG